MSDPILIIVPGQPVAKGRPRAFVSKRGFVATYTPEKTRNYEAFVKWCAMDAMQGRTLLLGAVIVEIRARMEIPASWSRKKRNAALGGLLRPTGRPDCDNVGKICLDALNGLVWKDDSQVVDLKIVKLYDEQPALEVIAREIATANTMAWAGSESTSLPQAG